MSAHRGPGACPKPAARSELGAHSGSNSPYDSDDHYISEGPNGLRNYPGSDFSYVSDDSHSSEPHPGPRVDHESEAHGRYETPHGSDDSSKSDASQDSDASNSRRSFFARSMLNGSSENCMEQMTRAQYVLRSLCASLVQDHTRTKHTILIPASKRFYNWVARIITSCSSDSKITFLLATRIPGGYLTASASYQIPSSSISKSVTVFPISTQGLSKGKISRTAQVPGGR